MHSRAAELIATLKLVRHPEGGFYSEIFRSSGTVIPEDNRGPRSALTTIYFLLTDDEVSRWHRVRSDEVWHVYEGGPLEVLSLDLTTKQFVVHQLGAVDDEDARPVCVIEAGRWQAARTLGPYALVGCTVGPGFDFADFVMMSNDSTAAGTLRAQHPALVGFL